MVSEDHRAHHALADGRRLRNRGLVRGIGTSLVARGVSVLAPLLLVPLTLNHLGSDAYAVWMSAASLTAMAAFADLGLGQGLLTRLPPLLVAGRTTEAKRVTSTVYLLLSGLAGLIIVAVCLFSQFVSWATVLGVGRETPQADTIVMVCLVAFIANIPLSLIVRVQFALQAVSQANLWQATGAAWSVALASAAVWLDLSSVIVIAGAVLGPLIANAAASIAVYKRHPHLAPRLKSAAFAGAWKLIALGAGYLALNVVMSVSTNIDLLLVGHGGSVAGVVAFAVATRLFAQVGAVVSLVNVPLWPANAEAISRGDLGWVVRTTRIMTLGSASAVIAFSVPLVVMGADLFARWTGQELQITRTLLLGCGAWWLLLATLSPRFMVQNSVGVVMPQLVGWGAFLCLSIGAKWWALNQFDMQWVPAAGTAVALVTVLPGCLVGYKRALHRGGPVTIGAGNES